MANDYLFTSESVSEGHPDKVADQISDVVLDAILAEDDRGRVACETLVKTGVVIVAGEITTSAWVDVEALVRKTVLDIGYNSSELGFDGATCGVLNLIGKQSPDIAQGVDRKDERRQGAGDQGLMFGYATNETDVLMPAPIALAHRLVKKQAQVLKAGKLPRPPTTRHSSGAFARRGGGACSGSDPPKVDRSAAYAARYVAKNIVAAGLAERCEAQVSYAIGVPEPTSIMVETFGTSRLSRERLTELIRKHFDLTPYGLREMLDLLRPI